MNSIKRRLGRAFTLIELVVVIVILGILAAIAAFAYASFIDRSRQNAVDRTADQVAKAVAGSSAAEDLRPLDLLDTAPWAGDADKRYTITSAAGVVTVTGPEGHTACVVYTAADGPGSRGEVQNGCEARTTTPAPGDDDNNGGGSAPVIVTPPAGGGTGGGTSGAVVAKACTDLANNPASTLKANGEYTTDSILGRICLPYDETNSVISGTGTPDSSFTIFAIRPGQQAPNCVIHWCAVGLGVNVESNGTWEVDVNQGMYSDYRYNEKINALFPHSKDHFGMPHGQPGETYLVLQPYDPGFLGPDSPYCPESYGSTDWDDNCA